MNNLTDKKCIPCEGGVDPLSKEGITEFLKIVPGWALGETGDRIKREFQFKDFKESMAFVSKVAVIAEAENHHPDIHIFYNKVNLELYTHAIGGLHENDFIVAAKINAITI
jgi:4a-hydroxytetrahydrobiopterin dehydratase